MKLNKQQIESIFLIASWSPSPSDIAKINERLGKALQGGESITTTSGQSIVSTVCPDALLIVREGIDNSDLNTMLHMLTREK